MFDLIGFITKTYVIQEKITVDFQIEQVLKRWHDLIY